MNLTLPQIRAFVTVSRCGSFTLAAHALHRTQPTVTSQIRQMEEALGLRLFDRSTRQLRLTAVGRDLAPVLARMLHELDDVTDSARQLMSLQRGVVRLSALPSIAANYLPPRIAAFRRDHPALAFVLRDALDEEVQALVRSGQVEFGITDQGPGTADLEVTPLMDDSVCAVYMADHPLDRVSRIDIDALCRFDLILMAPGSGARRLVDAAFGALGRHALPACEATYNATAIGMVRAGLGVALMPAASIDPGIEPALRARPVASPGFLRRIGLIRRQNATLSPGAKTFFDVLLADPDRPKTALGG